MSPASTSVKVPAGSAREKSRADDRVLAGGLGRKHRRVVGAVNGDRERRRGCGAGRIAHGVAEDIGQRIGRLPQRLHGGIRLVDGVGEGACGIEHEAAMRSGERCAKRAGRRAEADRGDGLGVAGVGIGVVGQDIAGGGRAARAVGNAALLGGIGRVGDRRRRGVRRRTGEHHIGPVVGGAEGVGREDAGGAGSAIGSRRRCRRPWWWRVPSAHRS